MGVRYFYAIRARLFVISFSDFNCKNFLNSYARCFTYKVQINYAVYDHMDMSIEDMVIGSHN